MKINLKIDPYNYPIIIILAFVIGFVVGLALGFGPQHGSRETEHQIFFLAFLLPNLPAINGDVP